MKQTTFCAILLLATGCTSPKKAHTADPLRVGTIVVTPSSDIDAALYVGTIEEETSAALSFPVAGTLARTYADEGQRVQQGQLLAELDRRRPADLRCRAGGARPGERCLRAPQTALRRRKPARDQVGRGTEPTAPRPSRHTASPAKTSTTASCTRPSRASSANGRPQRGRRFCRASRP